MEIDMTREEAIKELRGFIGQLTEGCQEVIKVLVPELRESEDERVRKELIAILKKSYNSGITLNNKKDLDRYLAYLERQKEPENVSATTMIPSCWEVEQKEQKPPIAGNDFGWIDELKHDLKHPEELDEKVQEVLKKRQKPVERSLEDDHIIGFVYDLLNEIEWKDNWAMSKEECLGRLKSLRPPLKDKEMKLKILKYLSTRCSSLEFEEVENYLNNLRPSWKPSEDEERLINTSISFLKDFADKGYENAVECIDWLKSKLNGNTGK